MQKSSSHCNPLTNGSTRRGDAAKVIIITVCVFAMTVLMLCVGAGVYGYVLFQRNFGRAMVQAPADVQKITAEITDITIPPQFTPVMGSAILGMKTVNYAWNPNAVPMTMNTWNQTHDALMPMLHLMEMASEESLMTDKDFEINSYLKKALKSQYVEFTENVQEFTIRGRKCQFLFVTGHPKEGAFEEEMYDEADEEEMAAEDQSVEAATTPIIVMNDKPADATALSEVPTDTPAEAAKPAVPAEKVLPAVRTVTGQFPGKSGGTTITIRVPVDGSDDDLLLKIIQSIR